MTTHLGAPYPVPLKSLPPHILRVDGYVTNNRGDKLYWRAWRREALQATDADSPTAPSRLVVLQHGYTEHADRYLHVVATLIDAGFHVFAPDAFGHGRSDGRRGDIGRFEDFVDDLELMIQTAKEHFVGEYEGKPYLLAHSNGGLTALRLVQRESQRNLDLIEAYAVVSPFCRLKTKARGVARFVCKALSRIDPHLKLAAPDSIIPIVQKPGTHVKEAQADLEADPLCFIATTPNYLLEASKAQQAVFREASDLTAPLLFLVPMGDLLVDPVATLELFDAAASSDKELIQYPGLYHELLFEESWQHAVDQIIDWFRQHENGANR